MRGLNYESLFYQKMSNEQILRPIQSRFCLTVCTEITYIEVTYSIFLGSSPDWGCPRPARSAMERVQLTFVGFAHMATFKDLGLLPAIQQALDALGFENPTEIQQRAIPVLLAEKAIDIHGQAQTGTGKTIAFGIPLLHKIDSKDNHVQALIVAPTRELVVQICDSLHAVARFMNIRIEPIYGGMSMQHQMKMLKKGVHVVVGTPGRLNDHIRRGTLSLSHLKVLVLDEADIMLDMGFKEEVDELLKAASKQRQIWLFSATVKPGIYDIIKKHMRDVVSIRVSPQQVGTSLTKQYYCMVPTKYRVDALCRFLDTIEDFYGIIFCPTKILTSELAETLLRRGYAVSSLHGDMSQAHRNAVIGKFRKKEIKMVIATDVAARGIDIPDLTHVINYALPDDLESYVHRVGRTGRAGKQGTAITFIAKHDLRRIQQLERLFKVSIEPLAVPNVHEIIMMRIARACELVGDVQIPSERPLGSDQLQKALAEFTDEQVRNALLMMLYNQLLRDVVRAKEIPISNLDQHDAELCELFLNVGSDDGLDQDDIVAYLEQSGKTKRADLKKVKVMRRQSFVVLPTAQASEVIDALRNVAIDGQRVRMNITAEEPNLDFGGRRSGGPRRHGDRRSMRRRHR